MAIFGKKSKLEEAKKLLSELTEEELDELRSALVEKDESADIGEEVEKAEEDIAEKGEDSQTEQDRVDESVGEQEEHHEEKAEEDEEEAVEEVADEIEETGDVAQETEEEHEDVEHASLEFAMKELTELRARVTALEKALELKNEEEYEEVGTDADFVDDINNAMPASYLEKAKAMRI